jgi:hypothetical protein
MLGEVGTKKSSFEHIDFHEMFPAANVLQITVNVLLHLLLLLLQSSFLYVIDKLIYRHRVLRGSKMEL